MMDKSILEVTRHLPRYSLQKRCLLKIMTILCNNSQLLGLILELGYEVGLNDELYYKNTPLWKEVEEKANELVSQVCSSSLLKRKMLELCWPLFSRIMRFEFIYATDISHKFLQKFYWTDRGMIDTTKTIRYLISNKNIPIRTHFRLACSAGLDIEMREIWNEMSDEDKAIAENREEMTDLEVLWALTLKGLHFDVDEYIDNAVRCAVERELVKGVKKLFPMYKGNKRQDAAKHYLNEMFIIFLQQKVLDENEIDTGYFLFFEMKENDQEHFFNNRSAPILYFLLRSSEYELCLNLLAERLPSVPENQILEYLEAIFFNYHLEVPDQDGLHMHFFDVWKMLPSSIKTSNGLKNTVIKFTFILISDNFPFILERKALKKIAVLNSSNVNSRTLAKKLNFHQGKWEILLFFIEEEVLTIPLLKIHKKDILKFFQLMPFGKSWVEYLVERNSDKVTWKNLLRFIRYGGRKKFPKITHIIKQL